MEWGGKGKERITVGGDTGDTLVHFLNFGNGKIEV